MFKALELNLDRIANYISSLKRADLVEIVEVRSSSYDEVEFIVEECILAPYTHKHIINKGLLGCVLCPLAAMAMVILALERLES